MHSIKPHSEFLIVEFLGEHKYNTSVMAVPLGTTGYYYELVMMESDYNSFEIQLFLWFRNIISFCDSKNAENLLPEMMKIYRQFKTHFSFPLREYILMEGIVELCYRINVSDSILVSQVLNLVYECCSSLGLLHRKALSKNCLRLIGYPKRRNEKQSFLTFFLEHSRRSKLQFKGERMIDVNFYATLRMSPVFVAAETGNWKTVLTYLQFGARIEDVANPLSPMSHEHHLTLHDLLRSLIERLWEKLVQPSVMLRNQREIEEYCQKLAPAVKNLCKTFAIILRAIRCLNRDCLDFMLYKESDEWTTEVSSRRILYHSTIFIMIPYLSKRYMQPDELQHGCRWVIRKRLNENWQLPYGIRYLPVPSKIQRYLNLLSG
ncbi:uncharacterized protein LOC118181970 [Stegodyphus dumicola]|uniref:uncharacterized protein LOC118181970 n=1 Tax=Stegodyphus dumicola TaxID=202533 RepID=UPI0015AE1DDF|nr:uncharacterized protein LOC118181970 [Stegodyphus dumicola]